MNADRQAERCRRLISLADEVIETYEAPGPGVFAAGWVDPEKFRQWRSSSISFIEDLVGEQDSYLAEFRVSTEGGASSGTTPIKEGKGVLVAIRDDLEAGYLTSIRRLIRAEVFTDFLDMADHLHDNGYHHAAVSITGAVLEDGLRQLAEAVDMKPAGDLSGLSSQLLQAQAIEPLRRKELQVWTDLRNAADHGDWDQVTEDRAADMIRGVTRFLAEEMPKP